MTCRKFTPVFTLSKGATVDNADSLTFTNGSQTRVIVRAEDGKHVQYYWITPYQMELTGSGTEAEPVPDRERRRFQEIRPNAPGWFLQADV